MGRYAADLATMSAMMVIENSAEFAEKGTDARLIVEGLISAGVASCIAGSSRPCSGSEHLFSHALDAIAPGVGLHGEKCGIGSIMMAKLHGQDWRRIARALRDVGAPTTAEQVGLDADHIVRALCMAPGAQAGALYHTVRVGDDPKKGAEPGKEHRSRMSRSRRRSDPAAAESGTVRASPRLPRACVCGAWRALSNR